MATYNITIDGKTYRVELGHSDGRWSCLLNGRETEIEAILFHRDVLSLRVGNQVYEIKRDRTQNDVRIWVGNTSFVVEVRDPRSFRSRQRPAESDGPRKLTAPMPGKVVRVLSQEGATVDLGSGVVVVEAMKMQNEIKSPKKGVIQKILVREGAAVNAGDVLAIVG